MEECTMQSVENISVIANDSDGNVSLTATKGYPSELQTVSAVMIRTVPPILFIIGLSGNIMTIFILSKKKNRVTSTAVFLTFPAVSDIIILLTGILTHWIFIVCEFDIRTTNEIVCKIHVVLTYFSIHFSSWILVLITLERTICVVIPHKVQLMFSKRKGLIYIAVLALILFIINSHFLIGATITKIIWHGTNSTMCMGDGSPAYRQFVDKVWSWVDLCLSFLIPGALILTGNILILVQLSRTAQRRQDLGVTQQSKQSLTMLLHLLTVVFLVSMAPYAVFMIISAYLLENSADIYEELERIDYIFQILLLLVALNPTLNFILYVLSGSKFRKEVKTLIFCQEGRGGNVF